MTDLKKSMGGIAGTFMALSAVLGSGMMILPGVSYHQLGKSAWIPWAIAAVSVIPLLSCYAWLGRRYPSASGIAYYAEVALGPAVGRTVGIIATIGLVAAVPATALTGGRYVAQFLGIGAAAQVFPIVVLAGGTIVAYLGANVSSKLQVALIIGLFALVTCIAVVALAVHGFAPPNLALPAHGDLGGVLTAVYVAFVGWETVAFTFEEHKRSDLIPRIFAASFAIVVVLYALLLLGLFATVDPADGRLDSAPLVLLAERALGSLARPVMLIVVIACITANVFAAALALSRLVFGLARSGYLPAKLSRVRERDRNPVAAVLVVGATLTLIATLGASGLFSFEVLFSVTGGLYFVLYGIGVAAFARLAKGIKARVITVVSAITVAAVTLIAGPSMWWSWAAFLVVLLGVVALGRRTSKTADAETIQFNVAALRAAEQETVQFNVAGLRTADRETLQFDVGWLRGADAPTLEFPTINLGPRPKKAREHATHP
ncbi:APC family permease [Amycolatopsis pigmentata]|uniref:APC family permease n=1 Tax=Amycolatopsis pigmentata TaxID=450801 RepID=A0ABW5FP16_9PSEU